MSESPSDLDRLFAILSNWRRRYVLYYLESVEGEVVELEDITAQLVEWERQWDGQTEVERNTHRTRLRSVLHHNHLPQLAEAGLVEYDGRSKTIRCRDVLNREEWVDDRMKEARHLQNVLSILLE